MNAYSQPTFYFLVLVLFCFTPLTTKAQLGPGGVENTDGSSALELWLRADKEVYRDEGITLSSNRIQATQWNDQSGYDRHIIQTEYNNRPLFDENIFNGQPVLTFNFSPQSNRYLGPLTLDAFQNNYSIFLVGYTTGDGQTFMGVTFPTDPGILLEGTATNSVRFLHRNPTGTTGGNDLQAGTTRSIASAQILTFLRGTPATGNQQFWIDGADNQSTTGSGANFSSAGTLVLGREGASQASNYIQGYISEVIILSKEVNSAERIIIENYLSAKYDIALGANDIYTQDDNANGDFDFDVAGIGRIDASNEHNDSQGTGIVRIYNPSGLDDDEFLIWGHDNVELQQVETTDVPGTIDARLNRIWKVNEVNTSGTAVDVGSITLRIDLSGVGPLTVSDLRLLVDTDNNGSFDDVPVPTIAFDLGSQICEFSGITNLVDGMRFTIGTINETQTPLTVVGTSLTGPGGVEQTNGASALEWWLKADQGVFEDAGADHAESGDSVYQWNDQSGFDRHILQTTLEDQPDYIINALNGQPVIRFDRVNEESLGQLSIDAFQNNYSGFMVTYAGGGGRSLMSVIFPTQHGILLQAEASGQLRFLHRNPTGTTGGNDLINGSTRSDTESQVLSFSRGTPTTGTQQFWINGTDNQALSPANNVNFSSAGSVDLGHLPTTPSGRYLDGDMAEVILLSKEVNEAERIIIENYLSAKYDITLGANDVYLQDENANGDYDFEVAGIGRLDASNIHDRARGTGDIIVFNPTDLDDDEFLSWGHDNGLTQALNTSDVPSGVEARFNRVWRVSEVNTSGVAVDVGSIDIAFIVADAGDITTSDLRLLVDTDNNGLFDDIPLSGAISLGSNIYQFTDVSIIENNMRFSLGTSLLVRTSLSSESNPTGPAGVGSTDGTSSLEFWFDANDVDGDGIYTDNPSDGTAVSVWHDKSGNNHDATSDGDDGDPTYLTSANNNFPGLDFTDNDDKFKVNNISLRFYSSIFTVFEHLVQTVPGGSSNLRSVFSDSVSADAIAWSINSSESPTNEIICGYPNSFTSRSTITLAADDNPHLVSLFSESTNSGQDYFDNEAQGAANSFLVLDEFATTYYIGGDPGNLEKEYQGYIPELIGYNEIMNDAQKTIISNYLSAKYNFSLTTADVYSMDDNGNGDYDHEVAGIGRVDADNIHSDAQGTGIVRILNADDLGDDEYLMWGHDNGAAFGTETTDIPPSIEARLERVWRVSEVNSSGTAVDVGSIDVRWDMNQLGSVTRTDLNLLIDTDNDGIFADETPIFGAVNVGNNYYQFSNVTGIEDASRFTLGTGNRTQTPLPIELLSFEAKSTDKKNVILRWQTAAEINNDFFTIEKSKNAEDWKDVAIIDGAGNSSEKLSYSHVDKKPYPGISYYRLKQTDYDGAFTYSDIEVVSLNGADVNQINIYPNPGTNQMTIEANKVELTEFALFNIYGQNVMASVKITDRTPISVTIDISQLADGVYTLRTKSQFQKIIKQ